MTSCDNHETSTSFTSTKMEEKRRRKKEEMKTSDLSFLQKLGQSPVLQKGKINNLNLIQFFFTTSPVQLTLEL